MRNGNICWIKRAGGSENDNMFDIIDEIISEMKCVGISRGQPLWSNIWAVLLLLFLPIPQHIPAAHF
jgi:hypothetical protein